MPLINEHWTSPATVQSFRQSMQEKQDTCGKIVKCNVLIKISYAVYRQLYIT